MPELPEVETLKRKLGKVLVAKQLTEIKVLNPKSFMGDVAMLVKQKPSVIGVTRRAKILEISFDNDQSILTHLKMTGQLILVDGATRLGGGHPTADWVRELPSSHTRIMYTFADGSQLFFNDQRLFGWMKLMDSTLVTKEFAGFGPDVIDDAVTPEYLFPLLQRRGVPIKVAIMDNQIMAGVGNIYACDALNLAQIDPRRPARTLTFSEVTSLLAAIKQVINQGIELGGTTTDGKYVDIHGFAGGYQKVMRAYDRLDQPCLNCGQPIQKMKLGGRGTYWCPACQK
jgi:formamidopyrimidine-DNA glycosylase